MVCTFLLRGWSLENVDSAPTDYLVVLSCLSRLQYSTSVHQTYKQRHKDHVRIAPVQTIVSIETHEILLQVDSSFQPLYPLIFELSALVHPQCGSPSSPPRGDALETDYNLKSPSHQLCRVSVIMLEFKVQKFNESASASTSPEGCMKLFGIKITTIYATMKNVNINLMSVESVADTQDGKKYSQPLHCMNQSRAQLPYTRL